MRKDISQYEALNRKSIKTLQLNHPRYQVQKIRIRNQITKAQNPKISIISKSNNHISQF